MAVGSLSPVPIQQFLDANGDPLSGGKLYFYEAGTSTPSPAYANFELTIPLANPVVLDAAGRAPELFLGPFSYKCVLTDAANVTIWTADNIVTAAALRTGYSAISLTGLQHDVPVPPGIISFIELQNASLLEIDGFSGGSPGQLLIVRALGTGQVNLINSDQSTSVGPNRMQHFVSSGPTSLVGVLGGTGGAGTAVYVKSPNGPWVLTSHEQGGWIRVAYNALNYGVDIPGTTWTVEAADLVQHDYYLRGTLLTVTVALPNTLLSGTPLPNALVVGGFPYAWRSGMSYLPTIMTVAGTTAGGFMVAPVGERVLLFNNITLTALTNGGTQVFAQAVVDVI